MRNNTKSIAVVSLVGFLASCATPQYDKSVYQNLQKSSNNVDNIYSNVISVSRGSVAFASLEDYFTKALAGISAAETLVKDRNAYFSNGITKELAAQMLRSVTNCKESIESLMASAKESPMTSTRVQAFATDEVCEYTLLSGELTKSDQ